MKGGALAYFSRGWGFLRGVVGLFPGYMCSCGRCIYRVKMIAYFINFSLFCIFVYYQDGGLGR